MKTAVVWAALGLFVVGCTTDPFTGEEKVSNTTTNAAGGAVLGAAVGAAAGALASGGSGRATATGAVIGAVAGLAIGAVRGQELDRQEAVLREKLQAAGVSVTRRGDNIVLNMSEALEFPSGQTELPPSSFGTLDALIEVLTEFKGSMVDVVGFTDSQGEADANLTVSEARAANVAFYLTRNGVEMDRVRFEGRGSEEPVAPNDTPEGRAKNRRVEVHIAPIA